MTDQYKQKLEEERESLTKELERLGVVNPNADEDWIPTPGDPIETEADPNVVADRSEDWEERRGALDTLETRLNNVKAALARMEAGTFGICAICGVQIESDRLNANPAAQTCKAHINEDVSAA